MPPEPTMPPQRKRQYFLYASLLFFLSAWLIPDHYPPWKSFYNEFAAFLGLWSLTIYCALTCAKVAFKLPKWVLAIIAVALIPPIQAITGLIYFHGDALICTAYLLALAWAIIIGHLLARQSVSGISTAMAWLLVSAALISAAISLYQWLELEGLEMLIFSGTSSNRPGANLGQPNQIATLLCLGLVSVIYLFSARHLSALTGVLIAAILIFCIALTQTRVSWLIAAAIFIWWILKGRLIPGLPKWGIITGLLAYISLILLWPLITSTELTPTIGQRNDLINPGSRISMWAGLIRAIGLQPWTGYGWNQVSIAHTLTARDYPLPELVSHSHNILLDLLIWNGIPLGLMMIMGIGYWLISRAFRCQTRESWYGLLVIGTVFIHGLMEYPLEYAYFLLPLGILIGMIDADQRTVRTIQLQKFLVWPILLSFTVFLGLIWLEYRTVENDYRLARFEEKGIGPISNSVDTPDLFLLSQQGEHLRFMRSSITDSLLPAELIWMQKVAYRYPYFSNLLRYALALAINNHEDAAIKEIHRMQDLYGQHAYQMVLDNLSILVDTKYPVLQNVLNRLDAALENGS